MTNKQKLAKAIKLLEEVSKDWNEDNVVEYPQTLLSFDELVCELGCIELKE